MGQLNTIGVDLAKNVIQVSVVSPSSKELLNKALFGEQERKNRVGDAHEGNRIRNRGGLAATTTEFSKQTCIPKETFAETLGLSWTAAPLQNANESLIASRCLLIAASLSASS